jgi:hypothetical protein
MTATRGKRSKPQSICRSGWYAVLPNYRNAIGSFDRFALHGCLGWIEIAITDCLHEPLSFAIGVRRLLVRGCLGITVLRLCFGIEIVDSFVACAGNREEAFMVENSDGATAVHDELAFP